MPIYRFQIDVDVPPQIVAGRLRSIVRETPGEPFRMAWWSWRIRDAGSSPFIGTVQDDSFTLRRDIRWRNSFLPVIRGRFTSTGTGTRVGVTMFIHPLTALFLAFWFGLLGLGTLANPFPNSLFLWGMFIFAIALIAVSFFPAAIQAKHLISAVLLGPRPVLGL
jgi:hypothetical protein